ncbi:MAG: GntR family transcriptional regulator [Epulopiscium sp.]|nr:GntR family transcriptional regulator [Candidatus Epulonipiscium sp.]
MDHKFQINSNEYLPLRDVVFNTLRDAILTGKLQPGERLMENQLAEKLGVSRTPIREALRMLELEHLVALTPRKGAQVLDMTEKDINNVLEIRGVLEGLATSVACRKMSPEQLVNLKEKEQKMEQAWLDAELEKVADYDEQFHDIIFMATENDKLIQIYKNLRIQLYRYRMAHAKLESSKAAIISHHRSILWAIENRRSEEGTKVAQEHVKYQINFILNSMKR